MDVVVLPNTTDSVEFAGARARENSYVPEDASVGDLDGAGEYEIVLHQAGRAPEPHVSKLR